MCWKIHTFALVFVDCYCGTGKRWKERVWRRQNKRAMSLVRYRRKAVSKSSSLITTAMCDAPAIMPRDSLVEQFPTVYNP